MSIIANASRSDRVATTITARRRAQSRRATTRSGSFDDLVPGTAVDP